jgi:1,4-alpha-glucan branching enzyme
LKKKKERSAVASTLKSADVERLAGGRLADPFTLLGPHFVIVGDRSYLAARVFLPGAEEVTFLDLARRSPVKARQLDPRGVFEAVLPAGEKRLLPYRIQANFGEGHVSTFYDCYSFWPVLTDLDLYLFNEGTHYEIYDKLGAHPMVHQGVKGVLFAVWAPAASQVSVVGDFNQWDGRRQRMRARGASGVWELFVPH